MNINHVCFSHKSDDWRTPKILYNHFMSRGYVDLFEYCSSYDQYEKTDYRCKFLFINPPYSHLNTDKFRFYIQKLLDNDNLIALLIPSRTDTVSFHFFLQYCGTLTLFRGRLKFNESLCAPFPSCIMHLSKNLCKNPYVQYCSVEEYINGESR